jgi:hypothetical protein
LRILIEQFTGQQLSPISLNQRIHVEQLALTVPSSLDSLWTLIWWQTYGMVLPLSFNLQTPSQQYTNPASPPFDYAHRCLSGSLPTFQDVSWTLICNLPSNRLLVHHNHPMDHPKAPHQAARQHFHISSRLKPTISHSAAGKHSLDSIDNQPPTLPYFPPQSYTTDQTFRVLWWSLPIISTEVFWPVKTQTP